MDTKYNETVLRRMVANMTSVLQYLYDKMIVHDAIKPENLLVVRLDKREAMSIFDDAFSRIYRYIDTI